jgi:hypothetical protein
LSLFCQTSSSLLYLNGFFSDRETPSPIGAANVAVASCFND